MFSSDSLHINRHIPRSSLYTPSSGKFNAFLIDSGTKARSNVQIVSESISLNKSNQELFHKLNGYQFKCQFLPLWNFGILTSFSIIFYYKTLKNGQNTNFKIHILRAFCMSSGLKAIYKSKL